MRISISERWYVSCRYLGSQKRKNHQIGSVKNLPIANAQVSFFGNSRRQGYGLHSCPADRCESAPVPPPTPWDAPRAARRSTATPPAQMKPIAPVIRKVDCQPYFSAIHGTSRIVATAPMFAPELKIPVAVRALPLGKPLRHRLDAGREIRRLAETQKHARDPERERRGGRRVHHRRRAPHRHRDRKPDPRAELVQQPAGAQQPDGVRRRRTPT